VVLNRNTNPQRWLSIFGVDDAADGLIGAVGSTTTKYAHHTSQPFCFKKTYGFRCDAVMDWIVPIINQ
jgi:hypothetical protein